ncbi:alpha/beta hydrolase family protein [Pelagicoccus sp. SDUM812002]|uniref:alpha/beta fold hydrolase n=1 Tax=Pelagicoccus sp. SDUM812002 TaxID=3041266 RepID=UPI00280D9A77|nr:alpha/beta hydrolase family protein [Pelagicoccus sp. SDUM812002]MDQ8186538.1 alpha/beta hydrolase [Pelagicoccus sp. SDUM812002]
MKSITKLLVLLSFAAKACMLSVVADSADQKETFVIVHGATAGAWEWKRTGAFLQEDGHDVHRITLTGLGERFHLANAEVNLDTHIDDVVNVILFEDLHNVVLSGHSYGGMVVTGVMNKIPERIKHVIYLDAAVPDDGQSMYDLVGGAPPTSNVVDGLVRFPWYDEKAPFPKGMPHPEKTFSQPVAYNDPNALALPVTFVAFIPADQDIEERLKDNKSWQKAESRGWSTRTFPGGHVAQQEDPRGVASLMEDCISDTNTPKAQN